MVSVGQSSRVVLMHKLQRDCPAAKKHGYDVTFLPHCKTLEQDGCTMYRKP